MSPTAGGGQVRAAMAAHPRERFLPRGQRRRAAHDGPLPIGAGQTNSQPRTVAAMLDLLDVHPGDAVLDVGCGSAWTTALLAHLTGRAGSVIGVERVPELVRMGRANLDRAGMPWARVRAATPGVLGSPGDAPFDRVLVSAMATRLPEPLIAQLGPGGILVVPVAGTMLRAVRAPAGEDSASGPLGALGAAGAGRDDTASDPPGARGAAGAGGDNPASGRVVITGHGSYRFVPLIED